MWGDPSVLVWGKGALEANRSVQEIQSDLSVLWLPSRNHLKIGEFNERLVASAVTQNYKQIEAVLCSVKIKKLILSKSSEQFTILVIKNRQNARRTGRRRKNQEMKSNEETVLRMQDVRDTNWEELMRPEQMLINETNKD